MDSKAFIKYNIYEHYAETVTLEDIAGAAGSERSMDTRPVKIVLWVNNAIFRCYCIFNRSNYVDIIH